jgi:dethiobiotin synthetase
MIGWFITGTDTGVGKTRVTAALLAALRARGLDAVGMKPVACGCRATPEGPRSDDAEALQAASRPRPDYADVNPYAFVPAIAPHIAAAAAGVEISLAVVNERRRRLARLAPRLVVEGVGGWLVPLGERLTIADLARDLGLPVVLVVGMRLGCLNHALLTAAEVRAAGLPLAGWVANRIDPEMAAFEDNLAALDARLGAPRLGTLPHAPSASAAEFTRFLDVDRLLASAGQVEQPRNP